MGLPTFRDYFASYRPHEKTTLEEFIDEHGGHEIIVVEEAIHTWPTEIAELRQEFGDEATVEYLGKKSPHYADNDGLYFIIRPPTKKGKPRQRGGIHAVVYVF